jgi:glycosyltransferase involved in cell wall biosynthesis
MVVPERRTSRPRLAVVIPARNEERRLPRALQAVASAERALHAVASRGAAVASRVIVVLDRCTDGSAGVLRDWPGVEVVHSDHGRVGAARALGARSALRAGDDGPTPSWVACTDADSAVPVDWLITHLAHAMTGTDLLLGMVQPDPAELESDLLRRWNRAHHLADGHSHVHGANLGINADMYLRAGGFADVAAHEDVLLVNRVRSLGGRVVSTAKSPVLTSARTSGRAPAGMAGYLADLAQRSESADVESVAS